MYSRTQRRVQDDTDEIKGGISKKKKKTKRRRRGIDFNGLTVF